MAYRVKDKGEYKLMPQIIKRVKLRAGIKNGLFLFDKYDVIEGERPEDIAFKYYGDSKLHWVILMTNNVTDRYYQWPMTQPQFQEFLEDKYDNPDGIHHYEITRTSGIILQGNALTDSKGNINIDKGVKNESYHDFGG